MSGHKTTFGGFGREVDCSKSGRYECTGCGCKESGADDVYRKSIEKLPLIALHFIRLEAWRGSMSGPLKSEAEICGHEIHQRLRNQVSREPEFADVLRDIFLILKKAGYSSYDMIDDLRDLVNDSRRPATEAESCRQEFGGAG